LATSASTASGTSTPANRPSPADYSTQSSEFARPIPDRSRYTTEKERERAREGTAVWPQRHQTHSRVLVFLICASTVLTHCLRRPPLVFNTFPSRHCFTQHNTQHSSHGSNPPTLIHSAPSSPTSSSLIRSSPRRVCFPGRRLCSSHPAQHYCHLFLPVRLHQSLPRKSASRCPLFVVQPPGRDSRFSSVWSIVIASY
jgi:hypothetical protein